MSDKKQTVESFVPLYDNILVTKESGEKKTKGGLIIVDEGQSKSYSEGVVVKVGDGFKLPDGGLRPLKVTKGNTVIFRKMTEISVSLSGEEYFVVSEANVIGIL